jgi:hypothetical protein
MGIFDDLTGDGYQYYAIVGDAGDSLGFFVQDKNTDPAIRAPLAPGSTELSETDWHLWLNDTASYRYLDGALTPLPRH